ncbi:MAG: hypothetical protein QXP34_01705 [Candidatus Aenigmatarchaeota archaeon]
MRISKKILFIIAIIIFTFIVVLAVYPLVFAHLIGLPANIEISDVIREGNISYVEIRINLSRIPKISFDIKIDSNLNNLSIIFETTVSSLFKEFNTKDIYITGNSIVIKRAKPSNKLSYLYIYGETNNSISINVSLSKRIFFLYFETKYLLTK